MQERVVFSVIVPTHNRSDLLVRCIASILDQQFSDFEIIIIDDGSTDDTEVSVRSYTDHRIRYFRIDHGERSRARNFGISESSGQYICFVDDDDYILEHHLQSFYTYLLAHQFPECIVRTGFYREFGKKRYQTENYDERKHRNPVRFTLDHMCGIGSLCIPRSFLKEDKFPDEFWHFQDTHLFIRLLAKHAFYQLNSYTYVYVIHTGMGSRFSKSEFRKRAENNIAGIEDLFSKVGNKINHFLPDNYSSKLISEKAIQHSTMAFSRGWITDGFYFLKKANFNKKNIINIIRIFKKLPGQIFQNIRMS